MKQFFDRLMTGGMVILLLVGFIVGILALFSWQPLIAIGLSLVISAYCLGEQMENYKTKKEAEQKIRKMQDEV